MTHTPTPWKQGFKDNQCIYADYKNVANVQCREKEWQANAEFIVRAVNAHEELVEACKGAIEQMEGFLSDGVSLGMAVKIQQIKQALAKAERK